MRNKLLVFITFLLCSTANIIAQESDSIYAVIKIVDEYDFKQSYSSYWVIPQKSIKRNNYDILPMYIDTIAYNIIDYPKDSILFLRDNLTINKDYKSFLETFLKELNLKGEKIQEIKKKWYTNYRHFDSCIGKPNRRTVYMAVIQGCLRRKKILFSNSYTKSKQGIIFYIPVSCTNVARYLMNDSDLIIIELSDFSYTNPYKLIPKEATNYSIQPIIPN